MRGKVSLGYVDKVLSCVFVRIWETCAKDKREEDRQSQAPVAASWSENDPRVDVLSLAFVSIVSI